jgi:hypothetical protein
MICRECNDTGWTHEACMGRFAKGANRRPDGICGEDCGAAECYKLCKCQDNPPDSERPTASTRAEE